MNQDFVWAVFTPDITNPCKLIALWGVYATESLADLESIYVPEEAKVVRIAVLTKPQYASLAS